VERGFIVSCHALNHALKPHGERLFPRRFFGADRSTRRPLSDGRLAADRVSKLPLHRGERGLDIRPPVVVLKELFLLKLKEVEESIPDGRLGRSVS